MTTIFDTFDLTPYTFLEIDRGGVTGNTIADETLAEGVFKLRANLVRGENAETKSSNATLHIKPDEPFLEANDNNLVGHGVRVNEQTYEIVGQTGGQNYHDGVLEHYTVTLQESAFPDVGS